jgi:hypothetical protein
MRLIVDWEKSRQGDGGLIDNGKDNDVGDNKPMQRKFGRLDNWSPSALNDRAAFLRNNKCSYS